MEELNSMELQHTVTLPDGTSVPAIGQGTWYLGEHKLLFQKEKEALTAGIDKGMTLLDTAEMYGDGMAEQLIGKTIAGMERDRLFLVSKVYPHNAGKKNIFKSCMNTLHRMGVDYLDLYLLHWRGAIPLSETVACMEQLKKEGKIRRWGVSNFDTEDMKELWSVPDGKNCAVNQVLYHVASRGIEYELLPWMREHHVPLMAYCPLAQGGDLRRGLYQNPVLGKIAAKHQATIPQVMLAFAIRGGDTIAIPRSGSKEHTLENAAADSITLSEEELRLIDQEYPAPQCKTYLDIM
jgi:diketogulonate reductase-like aldo/keto reductase